jgi:ribosome-associated translation inhibitor RaiA
LYEQRTYKHKALRGFKGGRVGASFFSIHGTPLSVGQACEPAAPSEDTWNVPHALPAAACLPEENAMYIRIRSRGLQAPDDLRDAVGRRVHFALGRFGARLRSVTALVIDENGPRGGDADKRCAVELRLRDGGRLHVERTGGRVLDAVDEALERGTRALVRHLERGREGRRAPASRRGAHAPRAVSPRGEAA